jgi:hypothetical protein
VAGAREKRRKREKSGLYRGEKRAIRVAGTMPQALRILGFFRAMDRDREISKTDEWLSRPNNFKLFLWCKALI